MDQIKKKMAVLRQSLLEAEERADKAENELKEANERASNVSPFCVVGFVLYCVLTSYCGFLLCCPKSKECWMARSSIYTGNWASFYGNNAFTFKVFYNMQRDHERKYGRIEIPSVTVVDL